MQNITEIIKERVTVADVVGQYLRLERAGSNFKALCPFHNEKTPSFMVNTERNFWYCFGCQKGGDIFTFVQEMEGIDFREALERLAEKAGVEVPRYQNVSPEVKNRKTKLFEIMELACSFFEGKLKTDGTAIVSYLASRGFRQKELETFRIGFAPDNWDGLINFLLRKGYRVEDIAATGMLVTKISGSVNPRDHYDRFRGRIMFPVMDVGGRVIGFSGRIVPGGNEDGAKYINTPQTEIYDKSRAIYGFFQAKTAIKKENSVIIVEGNADVVSSFSIGVENVVAVSGTAMTIQQVELLKKITNRFKICFDMDEAGQRAAARTIELCLKNGVDVEIVTLPEGLKDVNDAVMKDRKIWMGAIDKAQDVMNYFFQSIFASHDVDDPKGRKIIVAKLLNIIKNISDPVEQSFWLKKLSKKVEVNEEMLIQILDKFNRQPDLKVEDNGLEQNSLGQKKEFKKTRLEKLSERILGLAVAFKELLSAEFPLVLKEQLLEEKYQTIFDNWFKTGMKDLEELKEFEIKVKYRYDGKEGFSQVNIEPLTDWETTIRDIRKEKTETKKNQLAWKIKKAELAGDETTAEELARELALLSRMR